MDVWFLSRYEDVRGVLRDRRFHARDIPGQLRKKNEILRTKKISSTQPENLNALIALASKLIPMLEAPDHPRLRRLITKAFQLHTVERMRGFIRDCAVALIKRVQPQGTMDAVKDFASLLPRNTIAAILGIPQEDFYRLEGWAEVLTRLFDPMVSLEEFGRLNQTVLTCTEYLKWLIARRRLEPCDDLISTLIMARDEQDMLSEDELIATIVLLFGAGEDTTVNLIGNGMLALCRYPEKKDDLQSHPEILDKAVEEMLRYDAPLQMTARTPLEDVEIGGKTIRAGEQVYVILGSANRDPQQFEDPDTLIWEREKNPHLSFADGRHLCVGAALARMEAQEAFRAVLEMLPSLELADQPLLWREHTVLRGLRSLPVRFRAA